MPVRIWRPLFGKHPHSRSDAFDDLHICVCNRLVLMHNASLLGRSWRWVGKELNDRRISIVSCQVKWSPAISVSQIDNCPLGNKEFGNFRISISCRQMEHGITSAGVLLIGLKSPGTAANGFQVCRHPPPRFPVALNRPKNARPMYFSMSRGRE